MSAADYPEIDCQSGIGEKKNDVTEFPTNRQTERNNGFKNDVQL
jgi:hypothetical protein